MELDLGFIVVGFYLFGDLRVTVASVVYLFVFIIARNYDFMNSMRNVRNESLSFSKIGTDNNAIEPREHLISEILKEVRQKLLFIPLSPLLGKESW